MVAGVSCEERASSPLRPRRSASASGPGRGQPGCARGRERLTIQEHHDPSAQRWEARATSRQRVADTGATMASGALAHHHRLEPAMSVKRKVTVPRGSSAIVRLQKCGPAGTCGRLSHGPSSAMKSNENPPALGPAQWYSPGRNAGSQLGICHTGIPGGASPDPRSLIAVLRGSPNPLEHHSSQGDQREGSRSETGDPGRDVDADTHGEPQSRADGVPLCVSCCVWSWAITRPRPSLRATASSVVAAASICKAAGTHIQAD